MVEVQTFFLARSYSGGPNESAVSFQWVGMSKLVNATFPTMSRYSYYIEVVEG